MLWTCKWESRGSDNVNGRKENNGGNSERGREGGREGGDGRGGEAMEGIKEEIVMVFAWEHVNSSGGLEGDMEARPV